MKYRLAVAAVAGLAGVIPSDLFAITKTFTGTTSNDLRVGTNWSPSTLPGTNDVALFTTATGGANPLYILANWQTGSMIWDSNASQTIGNNSDVTTNRVWDLSGNGGATEAPLHGGAAGDVLLMGTNATSNTLLLGTNIFSPTPNTGSIQFRLPTDSNLNFNVVNSGATLELNGIITGDAHLNKTGAGKLILSGSAANTLGSTGRTFNIVAGTVELAKAFTAPNTNVSAIASLVVNVGDGNTSNGTALVKWTGTSNNQISNTAVVTVNSDATLDLNGVSDVIGGLNGVGSIVNNNSSGAVSTLTIGGADGNDISSSFTGSLSAANPAKLALEKKGLGTFTLAPSSSVYSGSTIIDLGTLSILGGSAIPDASAVNFTEGAGQSATLLLNGTTETIGSLAGNTIGATSTVDLGTNGHLITGGDNTTTTYNGAILGTGGQITKNGNGMLTLSGAITSTGVITVNGGVLAVASTGSVGSGSIVVTNAELRYSGSAALARTLTLTNATISGTGTIGTAITAGSGITTSPGNGAAGSQAYAAGLDYSGGGTYRWELGAYGDALAGTEFDQIVISGGDLTLGGSSSLSINFLAAIGNPDNGNAFWHSDHIWKVLDMTGAGALTGDFANLLNGTYAAGTFDTVIGTGGNAGDVFLTYSAVPEPGSLGVLALGSLPMLRRRRATHSR